MEELVGALMDEGYSPQEVREMVGPMLAERDDANDLSAKVHDPSGREQALRDILAQARDNRQPPGPTVVVPSGVINSLPTSRYAKAMRVDTEDSYRMFRRRADLPEDNIEALSTAAHDELMGDFSRGHATEVIGNIMDMVPASERQLSKLSPHQTCIVCGVDGGVICPNCGSRLPQLIGAFDPPRGYASQDIVNIGFGERGSAASMYDDNPSATIEGDDDFYRREAELSTVQGEDFYRREAELSTVLGKEDAEEFYRLERGEGYSQGRSAALVLGADMDNFYRLSRMSVQEGGLSALIGDVMALSVPSMEYDQEIPLSFHRPEIHKHATAWKQGDNIYSSIRVTGWDGQPRVLTTVTPYAKEVGIVVGYSNSANIPPSHALAVLDPLARQLGASRMFPRLAAAAPSVLRMAHGKSAPLIMTAMPEGDNVLGWE